jgi:UDP-N-acetylglucosamine--N-acetylmuramyl-(pentapeptide) pyrophosphoryl-undecaprenol N-acetylglucosamine transferase
MTRPTIVLAGGGSGGHVFPLVAVADALAAEAEVETVFVGTARGMECTVIPALGGRLELLDILPIKGGGLTGALRGAGKAALALPSAHALLKRVCARLALSAGGYVAGPVGLAAWLRRIPVALLVPDSIFGLANRWLLPFAKRAYVAFPETESKVGRIALRTGVPLRAGFDPRPYELRADAFSVLLLGGSQGAAVLNERVPEALAAAKRRIGALTVTHQTGRDRDQPVAARYRELGAEGWVKVTPFIDDVAKALASADLVIQRSGAGALAELCAVGRPSILIPFPFAADDHQRKNAEALAREGAAVAVVQADATSARIEQLVVELASDPERRRAMAAAAAAHGRPDAARQIARDVLGLAGIPLREEASRV